MAQQAAHERVALVTGGARRIGEAVVRALHGAGMRVVVHHHRSFDAAARLAASLNTERPDSARCLGGDLLAPGRAEALAGEAAALWGRLDVLVNNASAFYPTPLGEVTEREWEALLGTNLKAPFFLAQGAAPHLATHGGTVVNITDIYARRPLAGHPVYCAAKAGLEMLTRALARELAPAVRVNAVAPGAILWPEPPPSPEAQRRLLARTALRRQGAPEDVAQAVLFLVRDARYTTGDTVLVDGGRSLSF